MKIQIEKAAGIALIAGALLMVATMVLHPVGGNIEHLLKKTRVIIISHSLALLAIPFLAVGFWGLTKKLGNEYFFSAIAFSTVLFGLISGMIAATINGLALPVFIQNYKEASPDIAASVKPILRNNIAINQAFDFVFIGAICLSMFFWSVAIILTKNLPQWLGYFGMAIFILVVAMFAAGFVLVDLHGFRLFIFGIVTWIILAGILLIRS